MRSSNRSARRAAALAVGAGLFVAALPTAARAAVYFVDNAPGRGGSDSNDGLSPAKPFLTIQRAATAAKAGDVVLVRASTYRETVTPPNSGQAGAPIVFQPYPGEQVTVSGADPVSGWADQGGGLWRAPVSWDYAATSFAAYANQVFVDGAMMEQARWPNSATVPADVSLPARALFSGLASPAPAFVQAGPNADNARNIWQIWARDAAGTGGAFAALPDGAVLGATVNFVPETEWGYARTGTVVGRTVDGALGVQILDYARPTWTPGSIAVGTRYRYFLQGDLLPLLDAPGEWVLQRGTAPGGAHYLYLRTPDGSNPAGRAVEVRRRDFAFDLNRRSYVIVRGFRLFACTVTTDRAASEGGTYAKGYWTGRWPDNGDAPSSNVTLEGLTVLYPTHYTNCDFPYQEQWSGAGICLSGTDHVLRNCTIRYSAGSGVSLLGRRHRVLNNDIRDIAYQPGEPGGGIHTGGRSGFRTLDTEIAGNTIARSGRKGMGIVNFANEVPGRFVARIHHNEIADVMLQSNDSGGIHTYGFDGTFTRIDHNRIHGHGAQASTPIGIYVDFGKNYVVDHNVVWDFLSCIGLTGNMLLSPPATGQFTSVSNVLMYNNTLLAWDLPDPTDPIRTRTGRTTSNYYSSWTWSNVWQNTTPGGTRDWYPNRGSVFANTLNNARASNGLATTELLAYAPQNPPGSGGPTQSATPAGTTFVDLFASLFSPTKAAALDWFTNGAAGNGDFTLRPLLPGGTPNPAVDGGQVIGAYTRDGVTVPGYNDPFAGAAPDLGAYESGLPAWSAGYRAPASLGVPLSLQGWGAPTLGVTFDVELRRPGTAEVVESHAAAVLDAVGVLRLSTAERGVFDIALRGRSFLRRTLRGVTLTGETVTLPDAAPLVNGDVDGDNRVTATDLSLATRALGSTPGAANWNARADLNGDGRVDASDRDLVSANLRRAGDN